MPLVSVLSVCTGSNLHLIGHEKFVRVTMTKVETGCIGLEVLIEIKKLTADCTVRTVSKRQTIKAFTAGNLNFLLI